MKYFYIAYSEVGNRECNEDSFLTLETEKGYLFVVADGLGGHSNGEVASRLVVDVIKEHFLSASSFDLRAAVLEANARLLYEQTVMSSDMMSTVAIVWIKEDVTEVVHLGDTRIYMFDRNKIVYQSKDDSLAQLAVERGQISMDAIREDERRNMLLNVLGDEEEPDLLVHEMRNDEYDALMICSDGFWEYVFEKEMVKLNRKSRTIDEWLAKMNGVMKKRIPDGDDNATVIVAKKEG